MTYRTILIDAPWPERGGGQCKRGADKHYKLMTPYEITRTILNCPVYKPAREAHLYLWSTNNFLPEALKVMQRLGFDYITNIAWVKPTFGLGYYFRGQHELCLFGVKGHMRQPRHKDFSKAYPQKRWSGTETKKGFRTPTTVIKEKTRGHSVKPLKLYQLIETVSFPPRLEIFAREQRQGWDAWGDELPQSEQQLLGDHNV